MDINDNANSSEDGAPGRPLNGKDSQALQSAEDWIIERITEIESWLEAGENVATVFQKLRAMNPAFAEDARISGRVTEMITIVARMMRDDKGCRSAAGQERQAVEPGVGEQSPVPIIPVAACRIKLNFRLLNDDRLIFNDRIVFSLLWKWAYCNRKRPRRLSVGKYKKATGFRKRTIETSLKKLLDLGYISTEQTPLVTKHGKSYRLANGRPYLGYRKLEWVGTGGVRMSIFCGVMSANRKSYQNRPAWLVKALGISRWTARRYLAQMTYAPPP